ncbi:protein kinase [Erythrobacter sp. R86502]|uniref:serine/threonine-protein kinase n=1 Tax=Erythrobacter sp. R86502 TaxID=3093846 RepID=UPI0036D2636B
MLQNQPSRPAHADLNGGEYSFDQLGRYRIQALIGQGAMADVYRAQDPEIGRTVAIKVLKPEYTRDAQLGARFLREARAAGALSHPHIATIYDVGDVGGAAYIAMELIDGEPLDTLLQRQGRLPSERVLLLARQLADALAYAHRAGIVHRDVKPSNIMVCSDGQTAKLLDFGVARVGEVDPASLARTQMGQLLGTPRYMSPEQALGLPVDHRSDLFSLGVVLYEMVTGKIAFPGGSLATLAIQIAQEKVAPIGEVSADCPAGLRAIIDRLLAKKPENRFADGVSLVAAIDRELAAERDEGSERRGRSMRFALPVALVSVTAMALAASVYFISERETQLFERMAAASGASIAAFVTDNAAVTVVDNAGLPAAEQNWTALQAFVVTASDAEDVRRIIIADNGGTIRAATNAALIGTAYRAPSKAETASEGMRFVRPINYANVRFGMVDLVLDRSPLDQAIATSRTLMMVLSSLIMALVLVVGYLSGVLVARPLRRLRRALEEASKGDFSVRLTHKRNDEFGDTFDAFNRFAAEAEARAATRVEPVDLAATRIAFPS